MALRTRKKRIFIRNRQEGHKRYIREQRHRTLKVAVVSAIVLLLIIVMAGFVYAWYSGRNPIKLVTIPKLESTTQKSITKPVTVNDKMRVGVYVQLISSPVAPGDNATMSIHTNPLVDCSVEVKYDTTKAIDSGLGPKKADEFGVVTWSWTVPKTAPEGKWPVRVTCKNKHYSGVGVGTLEVSTKKATSASQP